MIGLRRGCVALEEHQAEWEEEAECCIAMLLGVLHDVAIAAEHVGSTSIPTIHAKPIIDIAVGVKSVYDVLPYRGLLEENGVSFRGEDIPGQLLFVMGHGDVRTHHIHVVEWNGEAWRNYILFRDYLRAFPEKAMAYDDMKTRLAAIHPSDRKGYTQAKAPMISLLIKEAREIMR